ncbi:MAG: hypothetical protein LBF12_04140 [Christensenellaceae bacterium]|jgi:heterodisulfide reductase subunit B|nr:hypothetical protein [Christensenellaceae bacterium]
MINYQFAETLKMGDLLVTCSKCTHIQIESSEAGESLKLYDNATQYLAAKTKTS